MTFRTRMIAAVVLAGLMMLGLWLVDIGPGSSARRGVDRDDGDGDRSARAGAGGSGGRASGDARTSPDAGLDFADISRPGPVRLSPATTAPDEAAHGAFVGRVVSAGTGLGVAAAELSFHHPERGHGRSVTTGARGDFRYEPGEAGTHVLVSITAEGHLPFAPEWGDSPIAFEAAAGMRVEGVVLQLVPARSYDGRVVDAEGEAVAGARVQILAAGAREQALAALRDRFETDTGGAFEFVAPDGAVLEARHDEHGVGRAAVDFSVQASHRMVIRLGADDETMRAEESIRGRAVYADDSGVDGALVQGRRLGDRRGGGAHRLRPQVTAVADEEGRFTLVGLDPGRYRVVARSPERGASGALHGVRTGTDDARVVLNAAGVIRGAVTDGTGVAVPAFAVVVERPLGPLARRTVAIENVFSASGRYEVGGLTNGPHLVTVSAHGYAASDPVEVVVGAEPVEADVTLSRGGRMHGVVRSEAGARPLGGARVSLEGRVGGGNGLVPLLATVVTDAQGRYELSGIAPGLRSVMVAAQDHHARLLGGMVVRDGVDLEVDATLSPTEGEQPRIELAGIGAVLSARGEALVVGRVIEGGGAAEAGLAPGDAILSVDGVPVTELGFGGSIQRIRGPEGSTVRLGVRRADGENVETIEVPRRRIRA